MSVEYKWDLHEVMFKPEITPEMTEDEIAEAVNKALLKSIGDFREGLGLSREASPEEIAAENYCHECGRPFDEEEE